MNKYYNISDCVDTLESYVGRILLKENSLLFPYIGLGIVEHPLNPTSRLQSIDYSYIVAMGLRFLKINNSVVIDEIQGVYSEENSVFLGGMPLFDSQKEIHELEIQANEIFLYVPDGYKISSSFWSPIDTPRFKRNMDEAELNNFILNKNIPFDLGNWHNSAELGSVT